MSTKSTYPLGFRMGLYEHLTSFERDVVVCEYVLGGPDSKKMRNVRPGFYIDASAAPENVFYYASTAIEQAASKRRIKVI